jgi:signal transduction histidine kinase
VDIRLSLDTKQIQLEIRDNGQGIPKKRIRELGGSMEIQSDRTGTKVVVRIPTTEKASSDPKANGESGRSVSAADQSGCGARVPDGGT